MYAVDPSNTISPAQRGSCTGRRRQLSLPNKKETKKEAGRESGAAKASDATCRRPNVYRGSTSGSVPGYCASASKRRSRQVGRATSGDCNLQGLQNTVCTVDLSQRLQNAVSTVDLSQWLQNAVSTVDLSQWLQNAVSTVDDATSAMNCIHPGTASTRATSHFPEQTEDELGDTTVMCGDLNARSGMWDLKSKNPQGKALEEALGDVIFIPLTIPLPRRLASRQGTRTAPLNQGDTDSTIEPKRHGQHH